MCPVTTATFVEDIRGNGLLLGDQVDELTRYLQPRFNDPSALAKYLVQRRWLTVYQINQLLQDQGKDLVLGSYRILDCLGEGAISQVFKAWDTRRKCTVALKVLYPYLVSQTRAERQFQREIQVLTSLKHPNIIAALDTGEVGGRHFLAMPYLEGIDLAKHVQLSGPVPVDQACDYIRQTALGLQHAHEQRLVHRDIKPANLFVTHSPESSGPAASPAGQALTVGGTWVKILDWGLAHLQRKPTMGKVKQEPRSTWIHDGMLIGTADYLAPEQAKHPRRVDIRADMYSLGCTFYYLLTGRPPFPGNSLVLKLQQHAEAQPPAVQLLPPALNAVLTMILHKMLAKRPDDRYRTPAGVAAALTALCRALTGN